MDHADLLGACPTAGVVFRLWQRRRPTIKPIPDRGWTFDPLRIARRLNATLYALDAETARTPFERGNSIARFALGGLSVRQRSRLYNLVSHVSIIVLYWLVGGTMRSRRKYLFESPFAG